MTDTTTQISSADTRKEPATLEDRMRSAGGATRMLRGPGQLGPYVFPGIPAEYTNWRDEVRACSPITCPNCIFGDRMCCGFFARSQSTSWIRSA